VEERIAQRVADLTLCRDRFPALFDLDLPLPLAVGIDKPLGVIIGHDRAAFLLNWWTEWPAYVAAVAAGGCRYRLDGSEAGEISDDHRETAAARIRAARALGQPGKGAP
jgi:sRNA-binding protein